MSDEAKKNPLEQFIEHEATALKEVGRALISLIPSGVREHGWNALEHSVKGVGVLLDGLANEAGKVVEEVRQEFVSQPSEGKTKVEVKTEAE